LSFAAVGSGSDGVVVVAVSAVASSVAVDEPPVPRSTQIAVCRRLHPPHFGTSMRKTVDALLFDLGRVIIDLDSARAHARWAELAGVPVGHIDERVAARVVRSEPFCRHERGEISDAAFFAHLRRELEIDLTDDQFADGWNAIFIGEMPGIRRVLSGVQGKLPLYAFSNTNTAHQAYWSTKFSELLTPFRKIYVSNEIGARKPEPAAFQAVVAGMGIAADRVLFFDDNAENVLGARASGLLAVQVVTAVEVENALNEIVMGR
jgi:glucose-1-phosphatase